MEASAMDINENLTKMLVDAWNFKIATIDSNTITVGTLLIGSAFLILGILISRQVSKKTFEVLGEKFEVERNARHVFESITFYILTLLSLLFAMKMANLPLTIFTVVGGAFAIGFGLGSQNLVNNFMSGLILMIERPIKIGDYVEVDDAFGEIESIGMRSTDILTVGNKHIVVPNSFFLEKNVKNWTRSNNDVRASVTVGIAYGSDTKKAKNLMIQSASDHERVLKSPPVEVWFSDFGDSALTFEVLFWIQLRGINDRKEIESDIRFRIDELFRENDVVIAFPQRDVNLYLQETKALKTLNNS